MDPIRSACEASLLTRLTARRQVDRSSTGRYVTDAQSSVDQISGFLPHCIELRVRPVIMLWLAAASEQVNLVILVDNLEVLLWRLLLRVACGMS